MTNEELLRIYNDRLDELVEEIKVVSKTIAILETYMGKESQDES
jgi:hypothetical protein